MSRIVAVIPARMGSSRFPGKPLADLCGRPMLEHVFRGTVGSPLLDEVVIATCDPEIAAAATGFGAHAVLTSAAHRRATDRVAEAMRHDPAEIVVMVQGDEPMVQPAMIAAAVDPLLADRDVPCVNLIAPIRSETELLDRNTIKVVFDHNRDALYFSRQPIPTKGDPSWGSGTWFKQVCVIAFRQGALQRFRFLPQGRLERAESVDMLRFVENGVRIRLSETSVSTHAVDTPDDLALVATILRSVASPARHG